MPIIKLLKTVLKGTKKDQLIGSMLKLKSFEHVVQFQGIQKGLDPDYNKKFGIYSEIKQQFALSQHEQHAEQTAILLGEDLGFWACSEHFNHIYVDFEPCDKCLEWLDKRNEKWVVHFSDILPEKQKLIDERTLYRINKFGSKYSKD